MAIVRGTPRRAAGFIIRPALAVAALVVLIARVLGAAALVLTLIVPRRPSRAARVCLSISRLCVMASLRLASRNGLTSIGEEPPLTRAQMASLHGTADGAGFALGGLRGGTIDRTGARRRVRRITAGG